MPRPDQHNAAPVSPAPRFALGWAALTYALATLTLAYPALSGQFLVNARSDQYIAGFAFRDFATQALRAGGSVPHWNPYMFGGMPYVAAMHGDIFYPTALLRLLIGTDAGMTWGFIIHTFLAGLFTYGFLRAWGLGFIPSLVGGLSYLLSGPIASYASPGHDGKLFVSALLPAALWVLIRGMRDGRRWAWGALAFVIGLAVLSPHPQLLQYLLLTSGAFALFLALGTDAAGATLDRRTGVRRLAFALGAVLIGLAMGAIQFAPVREYVAWSPRAGGIDYARATSFSFPLVELVNLYLPQFTGMLDKYFGPNPVHLHSEYIGGPVLLLASLALGGQPRKRFRRFWLGVAVISLLWMLGGNTPFFKLVFALIPGTKFFRAPSTIIYVFGLSLSILAALGTERVLARDIKRSVVLGWCAFGALIALLATSGILASIAPGTARSYIEAVGQSMGFDAAQAPIFADRMVAANRTAMLLGAWRSLLFVVLVSAAIEAYRRGRFGARELGVALAVFIAADLWSIARNYWLFLPPARVLFATDPAIEFLKKEPQPGRVLVLGRSGPNLVRPDPYYGTDGLGQGTGLMAHGIRSLTGYHGNEIGRYDQISAFQFAPGASPMFLSPMFWRHENARYLYTNEAVGDTALRLLVGPVKNSAGSTVYLYRLPGDNPYAWVTPGLSKGPDDQVKPTVLDPRFDPRRVAVFSDTSLVAGVPLTSLPAPLDISTTTSAFAPGRATVTLSRAAPAGSVLVVSENYYPGWHALVDGKSRPAYRADFNLIGVPLPVGARTIELTYRDAAIATGKGVTLFAIALAVAALAWGVVADRRRLA